MISLRKNLLINITLVTLVIGILTAYLTYAISKEELTELFDDSMKQVAYALAESRSEHSLSSEIIAHEMHTLGEDGDFLIQIWSDSGTLLYTSHKNIELAMQEKKGFGTALLEDEEWRFYHFVSRGKNIQVSQPMKERHEDIVEKATTLITPILLQFPFIFFLSFLSVTKGLKSLYRVGAAIEKKDSSNLSPVDLKNVPLEIHSVVQSLNHLLSRLSDAMDRQKRFVADAAHELRTPLTVLQLQLNNLERSTDADERKDCEQRLRAGLARGIHLVQNLLTLSREEPGTDVLKADIVNISSLLKKLYEEYQSLSKDKNIEFTMNGTDRDAFIMGEELSLRTMFGNLLQNAILYTPEDGKVGIDVKKDASVVSVRIFDNGPGISKEDRERIFDRFFRVPGTQKTGSGLGLSIVRAIAGRHDADVVVEDGPENKGSCFVVKFHAVSVDSNAS